VLLSYTLWMAFATLVVASAVILLRACGLLTPIAAAMPSLGWNFCPSASPTLSTESNRSETLSRQVHQLELELAQKTLACAAIPPPAPPPLDLPTQPGPARPQQTAALRPPPQPLPADRWNKKDLSMLEGCWLLGRDTVATWGVNGRNERCSVKAGQICFDGKGTGRRETTILCPTGGTIRCAAPVTARFGNDGTLDTTQPQVQCTPQVYRWNAEQNSLTCRRVNDALATCHDGLNFDYEFRRGSP
jgi:hypothetical protein